MWPSSIFWFVVSPLKSTYLLNVQLLFWGEKKATIHLSSMKPKYQQDDILCSISEGTQSNVSWKLPLPRRMYSISFSLWLLNIQTLAAGIAAVVFSSTDVTRLTFPILSFFFFLFLNIFHKKSLLFEGKAEIYPSTSHTSAGAEVTPGNLKAKILFLRWGFDFTVLHKGGYLFN